MSNFFAYPAFVSRYGDQVDAKGNPLVSARWQTIIINSAYVGSIIGVFLNGFITDWLGYRKTLIFTMVFMIGANFIPFFSTSLPMFLAGELIQGLPWGIFSTLGVSYAADICPLQLRGYMTSWVRIPGALFCAVRLHVKIHACTRARHHANCRASAVASRASRR